MHRYRDKKHHLVADSRKSNEALTEVAEERLAFIRQILVLELTYTRRRIKDQARTMSASFATQPSLSAFSAGLTDYRETFASDAREWAER